MVPHAFLAPNGFSGVADGGVDRCGGARAMIDTGTVRYRRRQEETSLCLRYLTGCKPALVFRLAG